MTMFFQDTLNLLALGHALVLIVFCGGGLGFIGWIKQRLNDPLVNVACSLTSLSTITILTKEGAVQKGDLSFAKIVQVLKMLLMGVTATMAVSFLVFPISARKKLRLNLTAVTESLAVMLAIITEAFLRGSEKELLSEKFVTAAERHKAAYAKLDNLLKEAKLEHFLAGTETEYRLEKRLARQVQDITHNLGGLRGAATLQFQLLKQAKVGDGLSHAQTGRPGSHGGTNGMNSWTQRSWSFYSQQFEPVERAETDVNQGVLAADIFSLFISHLGPSMVCSSNLSLLKDLI